MYIYWGTIMCVEENIPGITNARVYDIFLFMEM